MEINDMTKYSGCLNCRNLALPIISFLARFVYAAALLLLFCTGTDTCLASSSASEVSVGCELDFRPYAFVDADGHPSGFGVDLISAVSGVMNLSITITPGTWDTVWNDLTAGKIDVLPVVARLPSRAAKVDFSLPHTETFDAFIVLKGKHPFRDLGEAKGKEIVVLRSDAPHHILQDRNFEGKIIPVETVEEMFSLIAAGKYDALLYPKLLGTIEIRERGLQKTLISGPPIPDYKRLFSFAVRKGNEELLEKLNEGLLIVKTSGQYNRIYEKWLSADDPWSRYRKYLAPVTASAVFLLLSAGLWTFMLRGQVKRRTHELARTNEMLRLAGEELEDRVTERTAELSSKNEALHAEVLARERAEAALRRQAQFPEENPNPVLRVAGSGELLYANRPARAWLALMGWQINDPLPDSIRLIVNKAVEQKEVVESKIIRPDRALWISAIQPPGEDYVNLYAGDITGLKRAEEALVKANEFLEQRVQERTSRLSSINEELEQEIFQREDAEKRLLRLNKLYSMLTRVNEAIVRIHNPASLLKMTCRIIIDSGLIKMAWIGILDKETFQVIPVARAGDARGYLERITIQVSDNPEGQGPTGRAIAENRYFACDNVETDPSVVPWRVEMLKNGFHSSAAFPLRSSREVIGALTCYSETPEFFGEEEVTLFSSLSDDISFSIEAMSADKKRLETEEALRLSAAEITDLYNNAPCGYHSLDRDGRIIRINDTELSWLGYSREEVLGKNIIDFYSPKSKELFSRIFPKFRESGRVSDLEFELMRKDGTIMPVAVDATAVFGSDGKFLMSRSTMYDVTERKERERAADASNSVLKLFSNTLNREDYLSALVAKVRSWCECSAVGVRLVENEREIPFVAHVGFSSTFLDRENCLSLSRDFCACTRVIDSQFIAADKGFVSEDGSFVCNDTSALNPGPDLYRAACVAERYNSIAIIPISYRNEVIGALHLADHRGQAFSRSMIEMIERITPLIGEALQRFSIEEELKLSKGQLQAFSSHLQSAIEEERTKIAREIHDELGQTLTAAGMELSQIKKRHAAVPALKEEIASVNVMLDHAVADIQKICEELRPPVLDHLGLPVAIRKEVAALSKRTGIPVSLNIVDDLEGLADSSAVACFRIFQEALTNFVRHSKATKLTVQLDADKEGVILQIRDNGIGIARQKLEKSTSLGLIGMRERAREAGGSVTFSGTVDRGTTVTARIPYKKKGTR